MSQRIVGRLARKAIALVNSTVAETLTSHEREVLRLLALCLWNEEIAEPLFITKLTVHNHVSNIMESLALTRGRRWYGTPSGTRSFA